MDVSTFSRLTGERAFGPGGAWACMICPVVTSADRLAVKLRRMRLMYEVRLVMLRETRRLLPTICECFSCFVLLAVRRQYRARVPESDRLWSTASPCDVVQIGHGREKTSRTTSPSHVIPAQRTPSLPKGNGRDFSGQKSFLLCHPDAPAVAYKGNGEAGAER
jgi:hypothetical protein